MEVKQEFRRHSIIRHMAAINLFTLYANLELFKFSSK